MSDNSDSGSDDQRFDSSKYQMNGKGDDICRDFLRNVCKRGHRCRYRHPNVDEARDMGKKPELIFCHDYQNTGCRRSNCKFLHCTREEEDYYQQAGQLPARLQQAATLGIGVPPIDLPLLKGEVPICKDFLKRECKRGSKCKYRHLTGTEYEYEVRKSEMRNSHSHSFDSYDNDPYNKFDRYEYGHVTTKRRRMDIDGYCGYDGRYLPVRPLSFHLLEDENAMLRRKVEELKKQVADLTATNEVLLEQNARYRVSKSNTMTMNAAVVPVSQTLTPAVTVAATPAQQTLNHLNASLTQQIALNSDMATQQALQTAQRLARELAPPGQANMGAPSLNPAVTLNPPTIVPVSLSQTNLSLAHTNMSSVSLAPVSLQQSLQPACSITQSIPQNLAAPSTTLVSYPIMSQSMRTAAVPSSLAH